MKLRSLYTEVTVKDLKSLYIVHNRDNVIKIIKEIALHYLLRFILVFAFCNKHKRKCEQAHVSHIPTLLDNAWHNDGKGHTKYTK